MFDRPCLRTFERGKKKKKSPNRCAVKGEIKKVRAFVERKERWVDVLLVYCDNDEKQQHVRGSKV